MHERQTGQALSAREAAIECARIADSKRAERVVILDVSQTIVITDFFVICSGSNRRQVQSIADEIMERMKEGGLPKIGVEGYAEGRWVLMDFQDVIIHLFLDEVRGYYDLEILWGDAPRVEFKAETSESGR